MSVSPRRLRRGTRFSLVAVIGGLGVLLAAPLLVVAASKTIDIVGLTYSPKDFSVAAGTTVVFQNTTTFPHTATADDGSFDTGTISPGTSKSVVVATPGSLPYHCEFHGAAGGVGQSGTITVTAAAGGTPKGTPLSTATLPELLAGGTSLAPLALAMAGILTLGLVLVPEVLRIALRRRRPR